MYLKSMGVHGGGQEGALAPPWCQRKKFNCWIVCVFHDHDW